MPARRPKKRAVTSLFLWSLFLFWFLIGPWPRDWAESNLFQTTASHLSPSLSPSVPPTVGPLRAGIATIDLTERLNERWSLRDQKQLPLAGYGKRALLEGNTGASSPLHIKALLLANGHEQILVIASDLLLVNRVLAHRALQLLAERGLALPRSNILFTATHTHSSLAGYPGKLFETVSLGIHEPTITNLIAHALADAAELAHQHLEPAEWRALATELPSQDVINRTVPTGKTNTWLDLFHLRRSSDHSSLATLVYFPAHATCDSVKGSTLSADYPGVLTREIESSIGGLCLFAAGAVGGMGPGEIDAHRETRAQRYGLHLATHALTALKQNAPYQRAITLGAVALETKLPPAAIKLPGDWRLSPIAATTLGPRQAFLQSVRVGHHLLLATPADFGGEIAAGLRHHHPGLTTIVTSFNGDYVGYILPDTHYDAPSYEPRSMVLLGPVAGQFFTRALLDLSTPLAPFPFARISP